MQAYPGIGVLPGAIRRLAQRKTVLISMCAVQQLNAQRFEVNLIEPTTGAQKPFKTLIIKDTMTVTD